MKIGTTPLITENIAPSNAKRLAIFNGTKKICTVDISKMKNQHLGAKLYSFGLVSDTHIKTAGDQNNTRFDNALSLFESQDCSFCCNCGDITNVGFWKPISESEGTSYYDPRQFEEYRRICQNHNIPVYASCGNHESYNGYEIAKTYTDLYGSDPTLVVNNLEKLQEYTDHGLAFTITQGNDVFIFVGQSKGTHPMTVEHLQWLYEQLETNRNKRCFVFIHSFVTSNDSGNPFGVLGKTFFDNWGNDNKTAFISLLSHYKNTMLFHGHAHLHFESQQYCKYATYSKNSGFRSVNVPSTANCKKFIDGVAGEVSSEYSLGYIVDVHENHVVLKGYDFIRNDIVPIAQYCIDTTIETIEAETFVDNTGTIVT